MRDDALAKVLACISFSLSSTNAFARIPQSCGEFSMPGIVLSAVFAGIVLKMSQILTLVTILTTSLSLTLLRGSIIPMVMRRGFPDEAQILKSVALEPFM